MTVELVPSATEEETFKPLVKMTFLLNSGQVIVGADRWETIPTIQEAGFYMRDRFSKGGWFSTDNGVVINCAEVSAIDVDVHPGIPTLAHGPEEGRTA